MEQQWSTMTEEREIKNRTQLSEAVRRDICFLGRRTQLVICRSNIFRGLKSEFQLAIQTLVFFRIVVASDDWCLWVSYQILER